MPKQEELTDNEKFFLGHAMDIVIAMAEKNPPKPPNTVSQEEFERVYNEVKRKLQITP